MIIHLSSISDAKSKLEWKLAQEYINLYRSIWFKEFIEENPYESKIAILKSQISRVDQILNDVSNS